MLEARIDEMELLKNEDIKLYIFDRRKKQQKEKDKFEGIEELNG